MAFYPVVEKFVSINGEGPKAGLISAFIRMKGCNLSCNYCDTSWANEENCPCTWFSTEDIIVWLTGEQVSCVTLTGGEPLLVPEISELIGAIGSSGISVEIETNGSVFLEAFTHIEPRPAFTMDYKCPGSGMESFMELRNFSLLEKEDTVKFVVSDSDDLDKARQICLRYQLGSRCHIFLSAVFGRIEPAQIVDYMISHHWNDAHLQLQMHKFIWPPDLRGV